MSRTRSFIEINSLHRNRNEYPSPTSFTAIFNPNSYLFTPQTARNALDPVYNAIPEYIFQTNMNSSGVTPPDTKSTYTLFDLSIPIKSIQNNDLTVTIAGFESNITNFYNGYNILLLYFASKYTPGATPTYIFDRTITSYSGPAQTITLNRELPRYTEISPGGLPYSFETLKYAIYDTSFNSSQEYDDTSGGIVSFSQIFLDISPNTVGTNNIVIDYTPYMGTKTWAPPGIFDNCYFVYAKDGYLPGDGTKPENPSINTNVRRILSTEVKGANPNELILFLDVPLTQTPDGTIPDECLVTNNNQFLNIKPVLNIQSDNIYGAFNYRRLYNNYYVDQYIENVQTREFQRIKEYDNFSNIIKIETVFTKNTTLFTDNIQDLGTTTYLNYQNTFTIRRALPENKENLYFPNQVLPTTIGGYNIFALPPKYTVDPPLSVFKGINGVENPPASGVWTYDPTMLRLSDNYQYGDNLVDSYIRFTTVDPNTETVDDNYYDVTTKIKKYYKYAIIYDNTDPLKPVVKAQALINVVIVDPVFKNVNNPNGDLTAINSIYVYGINYPGPPGPPQYVPIPPEFVGNNPRLVSDFPYPQSYEIIAFSYDNFNPILYSGSFANQSNNSLYDVDLLAIMMPNKPLKNAFNIGSYPYFYVIFHTQTPGNKAMIYSNNYSSSNCVFIVKSIGADTNNNYSFLNLGGMKQTINFKPNDNLYFSMLLPSGDPVLFAESDDFSPYPPRDDIQVSAVFSIEKVN